MITGDQIIFLIARLFNVYTIYKYMMFFFERRRSSRLVEVLSYLGFFILNTALYFQMSYPWVLILTSFASFILLSYNYHSNLRKRIMSGIYISVIIVAIEIVVAVIWGYFGISIFKPNEFNNELAIIINSIFSYVLALALTNLKNIKKGNPINKSNWLSMLGIPLTTLYVIIILFQTPLLGSVQILIAIGFLLGVNIFVIILYDSLQATYEVEIEKRLLEEQNEAYLNQFELLEASELAVRRIKHDWRNHISVLYALIDQEDASKSKEYIKEILQDFESESSYVQSGNLEIDSVLNLKLKEAEVKGIEVDVEIAVPEKLGMSAYDLTVILGNILDNAIEATEKAAEPRKISIRLKYVSGRLMLAVSNPFTGKLIKRNNTFETTKADKKTHGFGLKLVQNTIDKYDGEMSVTICDNRFEITILMFVGQGVVL